MKHSTRLGSGGVFLFAILATTACQEFRAVGPQEAVTDAPRFGRVVEPTPVPYVGVLRTVSSTPAPLPPGCQLYLETMLEGEAAPLGRFTGTGTTCGYNGQVGVLDPPVNPAGGPPPFFVSDFDVEQIHVAANGDELHVSGTGVFVQSLVDGSSGIVGTGTLVGGTGRFEGAIGAFAIEGVSSVGNDFHGWIAYDASERSSLP